MNTLARPAPATRPSLSQDQLETLEMNLHGVAGGTLRRKLLPVLQRKRLTVQRRLLTRQRQPQAVARMIPKDAQAVVKQSLLSPSSGNVELSALLSSFDWEVLWASLAPLLTPESYRTGDLIEYPNAPAEAVSTHFILNGSFVAMPPSTARTHVAQLYLRRQAAPQSFDGAKAASTALVSMVVVNGPTVYGLDAAIGFAPHSDVALFAGPEDHTMPNVVDTLRISNRLMQDWLLQIAAPSLSPTLEWGSLRVGPPRQDGPLGGSTPRRPSHAARRLSKFDDMMRARRCSATFQDNEAAAEAAAVAAAVAREELKKRDAVLKGAKVKLLALVLSTRERCVAQQFPLSEDLLKLSWLFQTLPQHCLGDVLKHLKPLSLVAGSTLAVAGESNRRWFFLRRGRCMILPNTPGKTVALQDGALGDASTDKKRRSTFSSSGVPVFIDAGCSAGELSLIFEEPRSHTIETTTTCDFWTLEQTIFSEILASDETLRANCQRKGAVLRAKWLAAQRRAPALMEILQDCTLFRGCWSDVLYSLVIDALEPLVLPQRTLIASASEFADRMLVIVKGNASSQRGDVPIAFSTGSIVGGACFVRHRWPFAVAATSIVDAWMLSAEKLRWIAERMDIIQTISNWEPVAERSKYLTKLQDMYPGGTLFPLETLGLLRRSIQLGVKDLIPVVPRTKSRLCHRGERRSSFVAHFRDVSMQQLEELCVSYPNSFNMNDLLFRTSYGRADDHLRKQYLASTRKYAEGGNVTTSTSEDDIRGTPRPAKSVRFEGTTTSSPEGKPSSATLLQQQSAASHRRRQRRLAFERRHRRRIKQIVGEVLSPSESSESDNGGGSDDDVGTPEEKLRKFRAHRQTHKRHGVGSGVLSHVDDGTVMNAAQLAADQVVMRRVLREQRKKERAALSMSNALVLNSAVVFNGQRTLSTGHGNSLMLVASSGSNSIAFSDDDRGSIAGSATGGGGASEAAMLRALNKTALPTGAHEWEVELRAMFAAGDDVIPTLRDMLRLLRMRTKKVRQRIKAKSNRGAANKDAVDQIKDGSYWADALLAPIADEALHLWVHTTDPEVTIGFAEHQQKRHDIAVSAADRLGHYIAQKAPTHATAAGSGPTDDEDTASEKTKMLLQLFRSGYAGRTTTKSTAESVGGDASLGDARSKRQQQLSFLPSTGGDGGGANGRGDVAACGVPSLASPSADVAISSSGMEDASLRTAKGSPKSITLMIPDLPGANNDLSTYRPSPTKHLARGDPISKSVEGSSSRRGVDLNAANNFPTRALYFEHIGRELAQQISTQPLGVIEHLQTRYQSGEWTDPVAGDDPALDVRVAFGSFVAQLTKQAEASSLRRQSMAASAHSNSSSTLDGTLTVLPDAVASRLSSHAFTMADDPFEVAQQEMPDTPRSCSSPALSDICWSEWDGYLEGDAVDVPKAASLSMRKSFIKRRPASDTEPTSPNTSNSEPGTNHVGASVASKVGRGVHQQQGPFESQLVNGCTITAVQEELLAHAEALRTGSSKSELLEALLVAQADGVGFNVWIDGLGAVPVVQGDDGDAVIALNSVASAEVAAANKVLRFAAKRRGGGAGTAADAAGSDGAGIGSAGGGRFFDDASLTTSYEGHPGNNGGCGPMRFPDSREAHQMIKQMERLADTLAVASFGKGEQKSGGRGGGDAFDPEKERRSLALAIDDIRNSTTAAVAAARNAAESEVRAPPQRYGRQRAVAIPVAPSEAEYPFRTDERHSKLPWFFEKDAGPDFLAEALAQDEEANKPKPRSLDDDDMDDEEDKEEESNERVVLVGSRQFNKIPRPLCRALPPFEDDVAGDHADNERLPKMAHLISFSAFADGDTLPPATPLTLAGGSVRDGGATSMNSSGSRLGCALTMLSDECPESEVGDPIVAERVLILKKKPTKSYARSTIATHSVEECASHGLNAGVSDGTRGEQHLRRLERVCKSVALRKARGQQSASSVVRALPMLPITPNMAVMLLPTDLKAPSEHGSPRKTVQWKSMVIPLR